MGISKKWILLNSIIGLLVVEFGEQEDSIVRMINEPILEELI